MSELQVEIDLIKPDIVIITEVFSKIVKPTQSHSNEYTLPGYQCFAGKINDNVRGVAIYVKDCISAEYCKSLESDAFSESVWCEISLQNSDKLLVGAVYKSPSSGLENHTKLNLLLSKVANMNYKHKIIAGDFNFPEVNWETWSVNTSENHPAFRFVECLRDNYWSQHVTCNTRYRNDQLPSCLDLILSDSEEIVENVESRSHLGASDHISLVFEVLTAVNGKSNSSPRPNFFKGDYNAINRFLESVNWNEINEMNVHDAWQFFIDKIDQCIKNYVPRHSTNPKFTKPKWMDHYCVRKVKKKYHAWKRFSYSRGYNAYQDYCKARNAATKAIRFSKRKFEKGVADSIKTSPKSFWTYINDQTKTRSNIGDLKDSQGNLKTSDGDKANILNDFFASVFTHETGSDLPSFEPKIEETAYIDSIVINPELILKQLKTLNVSKACGPDNCHPFFLNKCADNIYKPLSVIFSKSVQAGQVPHAWKDANVTCIYKKGQKSDPGNYRPVSLTSVICKLLERNIRETIVNHLNSHNLLSDCQFGFRKNRNTILQLLTVLEDWTDYIDNDSQIDTIYLDFRKAFDSVPHKRLIHKVKAYGITGSLLQWLENFLQNRRQRVVLNGNFSQWQDVLSGIPQGSILGPILFIIFVNDIPDAVGNICKLFADDCKLYKSIKTVTDQEELQKDLDSLCDWSKDWLLNFNIQKCKTVSYGKVKYNYEYQMTDKTGVNHKLKNENGEKDLGIEFRSNLNFDEHISRTVNKVNKIIGLVRRKFSYIDKSLFLTLYKSIIRSHIDYGNLIYFPTTKKNKQILENAQRRATRLVPELRGLTYEDRLRELNLTTLEYRRNRYDLIQTFRIIKNFDDVDLSRFFRFSSNDLRGHSLKLEKPKAKKSTRLNAFAHRVITPWNDLPADIVNSNTVDTFKRKLDKHWWNRRFNTLNIY